MSARLFLWTNLGIALVVEVSAFVALGYGAFHLVDNTAFGAVLAAAGGTASAVLWGLFAAPRARYPSRLGAVGVRVVVFAAGLAGLLLNGRLTLGAVMATVVVLNALALRASDAVMRLPRSGKQAWVSAMHLYVSKPSCCATRSPLTTGTTVARLAGVTLGRGIIQRRVG